MAVAAIDVSVSSSNTCPHCMLGMAVKASALLCTGADPGFSEGGVRIRGGSRREELTLVLYL